MREEWDGCRRAWRWAALAGALLLTACGGGESESAATTATSAAPTSTTAAPAELANPAAQFCVDQGGTVFGPEPMCGLPDGSSVDAWEFYRAETTGETRVSTAPAPSTVAPAPTTSPPPPTTDAEVEAFAAEPTNLTYSSAAEVPEFPIGIAGYTPYGDVQSSLVRVFEWETTPATVYEFPGQMNTCEYGFWLARWSTGSDTQMHAVADVLYVDADSYDIDTGDLSAPATAGLLGGFSCNQPGFIWAPPDANGNFLTDVAVEWQYYDRDWFEDTPAQTTVPATPPVPTTTDAAPVCPTYEYREYEPLSLCTEGPAVETLQRALIFFGYLSGSADGYFGPGTERAVRELQRDYEVAEDGIVEGWWYREFIETYNLSR